MQSARLILIRTLLPCLGAAVLLLAFPRLSAQEKNPRPQKPKEVPGAARSIEDRERDIPRERERFFYEERAYPLKEIPGGVRQKAIEHLEEMRRAERERAERGQAQGFEAIILPNQLTWTPIGPRPINSRSFGLTSGRIGALAVDPTNPNIVYLGGAQGGIWKTTDGGGTWAPLTDSQASLAIGSIAIDPTNCTPGPCSTIYVGTGEMTFSSSSYYGAGILKSTDGGQTWAQLGQSTFVGPFSLLFSPGGGARIGSLAVKPDNGSILLAGAQIGGSGPPSGIYRSTDGGVNWINVLSGAPGNEVFFDPASPSTAYATLGSVGGSSANGIYKSLDGGMTWNRSDTGLPTTNVGRIEIALAPSSPAASRVLYAGIQNTSTDALLGFFKSTNSGATWTQLSGTPDYCNPQCWYDHVIRVHPNNADVVFAGGAATSNFLIRSTNGGASWSTIYTTGPNTVVHVDQHAMAFGFNGATATVLYIGNDGGAWKSSVDPPTGPISFASINTGLEVTQYYPGISMHPSDDQAGIGGTQDNGTHRFSGQLQWEEITCGDGGWTAIDPFVPSTVYATCQFIDIRRSLRNGDRGTFLIGVENGIDQGDSVAFIPPFIIDPSVPNRLYFGTNRLYQTNDGADNWVAMGTLPGATGVLRSIAVAPSNANTVYVGTSTGLVYRTTNAGAGATATWTNITSTLPNRVATNIAVLPGNPDVAFVTYSGFNLSGFTPGHVFMTANGGATWTDISGNLPNTPANDIVIDPTPVSGAVGATLYLATDVGVFVTTDGGANWSTLVTGLPRVAVTSLKLRNISRTLRAATHGRGMWDLQLPGLPAYALTAVSPTTADVNGSSFTLTVRGQGFTSSSVIRWNGQDRAPTMMVSPNELNVSIPSSDLATAGLANVSVFDPVLGTTLPLAFTVLNAQPTLVSIAPASDNEGRTSPLTLTVTGTNYGPGTTVRFNGAARPTNCSSSTQCTADLPAGDFAVGGVFPVTVLNQPPGGGVSAAQSFRVNAPAPLNDNFAAAIAASLDAQGRFADAKNNVGATVEAGDPAAPASCTTNAASSGRANSIWYRFTPSSTGTVVVDTAGTVYDTLLVAVTGTPGAFTIVACDDDGIAPAGPSRLTFTATANTSYFFMVSAWAGDGGATNFNLAFVGPPPNDDIANAAVVTAVPTSLVVDSSGATTQTADPTPTCAPVRTKSVWYRYVPSANGTAAVSTVGSSYDTVLAAFTGGPPGVFSEVACNDDSGGLQSTINLTVAAGTTYYFMVSAFLGDGGLTLFNMVAAPPPGPDFSITSSASSITVNRGQSGTATLTITPNNGAFASAISFTCSGLPNLSACQFSPATVTPGGNPATVTLTITTTAGSTAPPISSGSSAPEIGPLAARVMWMLALSMLLLRLLLRAQRRHGVRGFALSAAVLLLVALASCGGGGGGGGSPPPPQPGGTPLGTFSVTVSGSSGTTQRFVPVTLTVR